jgi:hypothetical protein
VHTAEELYRHGGAVPQSRAFVLELMVVIILIIDLIWLFRGRMPVKKPLSAVSFQVRSWSMRAGG